MTSPLQRKKGTKKNENKGIQKQIENFAGKLKAGDTVDILASGLPCGYKALLTLETEYLNDPTMSDIVDGQFTAIGKIVRVIDKEDERSISLLRKTALSMMPQETLRELFEGLSEIEEFQIPDLEWNIKGPIVQIIPIAIFA